MPTEAEAGKLLWKAGESTHSRVAARQKKHRQEQGNIQGGKNCHHGFGETEIYH